MTRRQILTASRNRRRARESEFLYVLSFAEAVQRRRRPRPTPRPAQAAPVSPRPLSGLRAAAGKPVASAYAAAPTCAYELEDA